MTKIIFMALALFALPACSGEGSGASSPIPEVQAVAASAMPPPTTTVNGSTLVLAVGASPTAAPGFPVDSRGYVCIPPNHIVMLGDSGYCYTTATAQI